MQENMTTQPLDLAHEKSPNVPNKTTNSSNLVKKPKMSAVPDLDRNLEKPKLSNQEVVITSLISGALAGALAKTVISPLDRTKINFQINKRIPYSFRSAVLFIVDVKKKEGFFALWRGNSATMARIIPYSAIQFSSHEQFKKILKVDLNEETKFRRFLAGSLAGIFSQSCTYPLDLARARMAVTDKYSGYKNLMEVFVKIWQLEGPKVFYRGYLPTILGVIPYAGTSFFTYDTLKLKYKQYSGENPTNLHSLAFGAIAGVIGQTTSYPLDIVRRRMQTTGITPQCTDKYLTISSTLIKVFKEEGLMHGLYKGLSMNWVKGPIAVGISFMTYEHFRSLLRDIVQFNKM